ncbi:hypothetical protein ACH6EH_17970 [Paenibacillus sp. JSM ZJ436]|uniref:hypothetical protein n=1 Tax=Paenibacillus sp. JSM ZJ436 TaxID=3376190 RepID=UPI00379D6AA5
MLVQICGAVFSFIVAIVISFQIALALGMPWGSYTMGGKFPGKLPVFMRFICLLQIGILGGFAVLVMSQSGLIPGAEAPSVSSKWIWAAVAFSAVAVILNLITPSVQERRIWAPVSGVLLITSLAVAVL